MLDSDFGITNGSGNNVINNAGIIRKIAGTGTSTVAVNGPLNNTGTIEADIGTLELDASSFAQIVGQTLTGGTWNALDGATLKIDANATITTSAANVAVDGATAAITGLHYNDLSANSGSLALTNGATFATAGDFTNSGSLTVGAGSTLTVNGSFTQAATGTLNFQLGGTPASGQFGQLAVANTAALAGAFNLALVNGFGPSAGQDFPVLTYQHATGSFGKFSGVSPFFSASQGSASLDLIESGTNAVDLAAASVTAPTTATLGQQITVGWQASDSGNAAATGSWQDSVYLSTTLAITSSSILLGTVPHAGGLAAGASYTGSLTATLPALAFGSFYVLVEVDSLYQVPVPNRANCTLAAGQQLAITVPALTLGAAYNDSFTAADQDRYYQVAVPAGGSLTVALASTASAGAWRCTPARERCRRRMTTSTPPPPPISRARPSRCPRC